MATTPEGDGVVQFPGDGIIPPIAQSPIDIPTNGGSTPAPFVPPEIGQQINECNDLYYSMLYKVEKDIAVNIGECHGTIEACHAAILGDIALDFRPAQAALDKCDGKIREHLKDAVGTAWVSALGAGVNPPSPEQIEAAILGVAIPDDVASGTPITSPPISVGPVTTPPIFTTPPPPETNGGTTTSPPTNGGSTQPPPDIPPGRRAPPPGAIGGPTTLPGGVPPVSGSCPPNPPPRQDASSPTGWLGGIYIPVRGSDGRIIYCQLQEFIVPVPPPNPGGGSGDGDFGCPPGTIINPFPIAPDGSDRCLGLGGGEPPPPPPPICPPCEPPPPPPEGPPPELPPPPFIATGTQWCGADKAKDMLDQWKQLTPRGGQPSGGGQPGDPGYVPKLSDFFTESTPPDTSIIGSIVNSIKTTFIDLINLGLGSAVRLISPSIGCDSSQYDSQIVNNAVYKFIDRYTGALPYAAQSIMVYSENLLCQHVLPTGSDAINAYARGYFDHDQYELVSKANGRCLSWQDLLVESAKTRIQIRDAYRLFKLDVSSEEQYKQDLIRQGVDWEKERGVWEQVQLQYPPFGDLIRMMVRDAADEAAVQRGGFDEEFEDKWAGVLKKWGESQGVSDDIARMYWRAHWQLPSPGQLYDMLHRLRPDDRDANDPNAAIVVDKEKVKATLQQNDFAPAFIDALMATSYRPLTRVDVRRAYEIGSINDIAKVRQAYRDLGYDDKNARILADFAEKDSKPKRAKRLGVLQETEALKAYKDGLITKDEATVALQEAGSTDEQVTAKIKRADQQREIASRKERMASLKRQYFLGDVDQPGLQAGIMAIVPDQTLSAVKAQQWQLELESKRKEPSIAVLCKWFDKGLIDMQEYMRRVRNLRFNAEDAIRVIEQCTIGIQERKFKELEAAQAKALREAKAAAREEAKRRRELAPCRVIKPACPGQVTRGATHTVVSRNGHITVSDSDTTHLTE